MENGNKKYYIELWDANDCGGNEKPYIIQSKWFDTEQQALDWLKTIDYLDKSRLTISLMSSIWQDDNYTDIEFEYNVGDFENGKGK